MKKYTVNVSKYPSGYNAEWIYEGNSYRNARKAFKIALKKYKFVELIVRNEERK